MRTARLIALLLAVLIIPFAVFAQAIPTTPSPGTPGWPWWHAWNPYHPNYPHPSTNPYRMGADVVTYGQVVRYVEVPSQQVVIQVYVPGPGSLSGMYEQQVIEIPGYVVAETTTGYIYPPRWSVQQITPGVYQWVALPEQFQPR